MAEPNEHVNGETRAGSETEDGVDAADDWAHDVDQILRADTERRLQARLHRQLILGVVDRGMGIRALARRLEVNPGTIAHWVRAARSEASTPRNDSDTPPLHS